MAKTYKTSVLSVFDENGNKIEIPALRGKSAYEYAKANGYTGSETDFAEEINPDNIKSDIPTKISELTNDLNYIASSDYYQLKFYSSGNLYYLDITKNDIVETIPLTLHSSASKSEDLYGNNIAYTKFEWCFELDETILNNIFNNLKESNNIKIFIDIPSQGYGQTSSYAYIQSRANYPGLYFNFGNSLQVRIKAASAGGAPDEPV